MDVRSALNAGQAGLQNASAQLSNVSSRIAQSGTAEKSMENTQQAPETLSPSTERASTFMSQDLVDLKLAQLQAESAANVIRTEKKMIGSLINTRV